MSTDLSAIAVVTPLEKEAPVSNASYRTAALPSISPTVPPAHRSQSNEEHAALQQECSAKVEQRDLVMKQKAAAQVVLDKETINHSKIEEQHHEKQRNVRTAEERVAIAEKRKAEREKELEKVAVEKNLKETEKEERLKKDEKIIAAKAEVEAARSDLETKQVELKTVEESLSQSQARIEALNSQIKGYDIQIANLNSDISSLNLAINSFEIEAQQEKEKKLAIKEEEFYQQKLARNNETHRAPYSDSQEQILEIQNGAALMGHTSLGDIQEKLRNGRFSPTEAAKLLSDPELGEGVREMVNKHLDKTIKSKDI